MFLSAEYVRWLERLPCNRHARRRQQKHGQWLDGWLPEAETTDVPTYPVTDVGRMQF